MDSNKLKKIIEEEVQKQLTENTDKNRWELIGNTANVFNEIDRLVNLFGNADFAGQSKTLEKKMKNMRRLLSKINLGLSAQDLLKAAWEIESELEKEF